MKLEDLGEETVQAIIEALGSMSKRAFSSLSASGRSLH
jgi:hypothetical protein